MGENFCAGWIGNKISVETIPGLYLKERVFSEQNILAFQVVPFEAPHSPGLTCGPELHQAMPGGGGSAWNEGQLSGTHQLNKELSWGLRDDSVSEVLVIQT